MCLGPLRLKSSDLGSDLDHSQVFALSSSKIALIRKSSMWTFETLKLRVLILNDFVEF